MKFFYPFVSMGAIESAKFIHTANEIINFGVFVIQVLIGILTIIKIYKDIKHHKYKSVNDEIKQTKKKYPFIGALMEYLKKFKFKK